MFLRNQTQHKAVLARGHMTDDVAVGSVNIEVVYRLDGERLAPIEVASDRKETDPPDITRYPFWREVSVTAGGTVYGPARSPHVQAVSIAVGSELRRLIVFGERRWRRGMSGEPVATEPEPFEAIPLVWNRAFGGGYDIAPRVLPGSDMPHPGGTVAYPLNPHGMGLYADADAAFDQPLPQIERPDQLIQQWNDRPDPGGFAPCPDLVALRFPKQPPAAAVDPSSPPTPSDRRREAQSVAKQMLRHAWRMHHHATRDLIFDAVVPGARLELVGMGKMTIRFEVPPLPLKVHTKTHRAIEIAGGLVRSIHVDADASVVRMVCGYPFRYAPQRPPEWVEVAD